MNCTKEMHDRAVNGAKALAKYLGKNWTYQVWENLGWHFSVMSPCGRIRVYAIANCFTAFLGDQWAESANTPRGAIRKVIVKAKKELAKIRAILTGL